MANRGVKGRQLWQQGQIGAAQNLIPELSLWERGMTTCPSSLKDAAPTQSRAAPPPGCLIPRQMKMEPRTYVLDTDSEPQRIADALGAHFAGHTETDSKDTRTYLDTFDWRLLERGYVLYACKDGPGRVLTLAGGGDRVQCTLNGVDAPLFVGQLPRGRLHAVVASILSVRCLLALVHTEVRKKTLRLLDEREKTVAVAQIEDWKFRKPGSAARHRMPATLELVPVKGYRAAFRELSRFSEHDLGMELAEGPPFVMAAQALGLEPGVYSAKPAPDLLPEMPTAEAMRAIYRTLLDTMLINEPGVRENLDSEFLHDFRVAVRRTRCVLAQIKRVFPVATGQHFKQEFRWLGTITSPLRDLDVYLLRMDDYRAELPEGAGAQLGPLGDFLLKHHGDERQRLIAALDSPRYRTLISDWSAFLDSPMAQDTDCVEATRAVVEVASRRIWRTYRRVYKKGLAIEPTTAIEALHELRLECKKLRYLLELFSSIFPPVKMRDLIETLKNLQDNLGDLNDFGVQQDKLQQFSREMYAEKLASADCLIAMGRLVEHLRDGQIVEREKFAAQFEAFSVPRARRRFKELFRR